MIENNLITVIYWNVYGEKKSGKARSKRQDNAGEQNEKKKENTFIALNSTTGKIEMN